MTKKTKAEAKVTVCKNTTTYSTDGGTDVGREIALSILDILEENKVQPQAVLGVIGESVITLLAAMAEPLGYGQHEIVRVFGKSLMECEFKTKENKPNNPMS